MKQILITGVSGFIGQYIIKFSPDGVSLKGSYHAPQAWGKSPFYSSIQALPLNLESPLAPQLKDIQADIVIHTAAMAGLAECQEHPAKAQRINAEATAELAAWCSQRHCRLIYLSTDIVFDGRHAPYNEHSVTEPVNVYGQTKRLGELAVQKETTDFAVARIALSLGKGLGIRKNFLDLFLRKLKNGETVPLFTDEIRTPTPVGELVRQLWLLALSAEQGVFHLCSAQPLSRYQLGKMLCEHLGFGHKQLRPVKQSVLSDYPRPADVSLVSTRTVNGQRFTMAGIETYIGQLLNMNDQLK